MPEPGFPAMLSTDLPPLGRGRYDRAKTAAQRQAEHMARLVAATARRASAAASKPLTVAGIARGAGVGRSTFYALFRDIDDVLAYTRRKALEHLWRCTGEHLANAYTPTEKLRAIARGWLQTITAAPPLAHVLLVAPSDTDGWTLSCAGDALRTLLRAALQDAKRDAVLALAPDELRVFAAAALLEAYGRRYLDRGGEPSALCAVAVDSILRLFR